MKYIKKETLSLRKKVNFKSILSFVSNLVKFILKVSPIISLAFAVLTFFCIKNLNDLDNIFKSHSNSTSAIKIWKNELKSLRIGYSKEYIESIIGKPQITKTINIGSSKYDEMIYINSYFSLFCVYEESYSLLGFLIIGNDDRFKFTNYRCNFSLFDFTINEAEEYCFENGLHSIPFFRSNRSNRLDNNNYYFECHLQHSKGAVESCLIGYGICDIGKIESNDDYYMAENNMHVSSGSNEDYLELYNKSKNDYIRNISINSFLVMDCKMDYMEIISKFLISYPRLGMSRSEFANYQQDYSYYIDSLFEK